LQTEDVATRDSFAATLLCARTLIELDQAPFILEHIASRCLTNELLISGVLAKAKRARSRFSQSLPALLVN
jgi:hypothetical protein